MTPGRAEAKAGRKNVQPRDSRADLFGAEPTASTGTAGWSPLHAARYTKPRRDSSSSSKDYLRTLPTTSMLPRTQRLDGPPTIGPDPPPSTSNFPPDSPDGQGLRAQKLRLAELDE